VINLVRSLTESDPTYRPLLQPKCRCCAVLNAKQASMIGHGRQTVKILDAFSRVSLPRDSALC